MIFLHEAMQYLQLSFRAVMALSGHRTTELQGHDEPSPAYPDRRSRSDPDQEPGYPKDSPGQGPPLNELSSSRLMA